MKLTTNPISGSHNIFRCGDLFKLSLITSEYQGKPFLRTNLGSAKQQRNRLIAHTEKDTNQSPNNWIDIPFEIVDSHNYYINLPLTEVGYFEAKIWFETKEGQIQWAPGDNIFIKTEPSNTIANNSIYGAFTRQFGPNKHATFAIQEEADTIQYLDKKGYHVIPPSGTFRDLIKELDHIMDDMGFRILQLLPIHPTPTTYARMGRFGSPYAALDFFSIEPSLAEFDKQATPLDQFIELIDAIHRKKGEIFIDIPVDHTGWASVLQKDHPEYFVKDNNGNFASPGAWGTVWEDLIKLDFTKTEVHQMMAQVFLYWCEKGVDGFRCDAGYMIPFEAWQYIIAKVRVQYPNTIFLLEGLGGPPEVTKHLLSEATFSWAYSELFQNYSKTSIEHYINEMIYINEHKGGMLSFSETHDNNRLAEQSETWSKMRNLLCALSAPAGGFGISNGVEFFAKEKISVHHASGLNWGNENHIKDLFKHITSIFRSHPAFFASAKIEIIHTEQPHLFCCKRRALNGAEVTIVVNLNCEQEQSIEMLNFLPDNSYDFLTKKSINKQHTLNAGDAICIGNADDIIEETHDTINLQRAYDQILSIHQHINNFGHINETYCSENIHTFLSTPLDFCLNEGAKLSQITTWNASTDAHRHVMICKNAILYIQSLAHFDYTISDENTTLHKGYSINYQDQHFALVPIKENHTFEIKYLNIKVNLHEHDKTVKKSGQLAFLPSQNKESFQQAFDKKAIKDNEHYAFCANKSGTMAQMSALWGNFNSKYDSFFAVNIDREVPVDRTTMVSRFRIWLVCNDFSHTLSEKSQYAFKSDGANRATWSFKAPTGQGKYILLDIHYHLLQDQEQAFLTISRTNNNDHEDLLEAQTAVKVIIRPDIEYRSNHEVTKAYTGPEQSFANSIKSIKNGFSFKPYNTPALHIQASKGEFVSEAEWHYMHLLPIEAERGLEAHTDLFSPGYFYFNICESENHYITTSINDKPISITPKSYSNIPTHEAIDTVLKRSLQKYIVRRNEGQTVIAGYPWFLDWGRDTLICLRGIIAAGLQQDAKEIFYTFAKYEMHGSLPNMIRGNNANNRDTSDAPLWFIVALNDYIKTFKDEKILEMDCAGRSILEVIISIANNYIKGTPNGIKMDKESGLIYSPSHFTWMDTNYPAGTPRQGYPIEIQAFWHHSLKFIAKYDKKQIWSDLAALVKKSILSLYPLDKTMGVADCLHCDTFISAKNAKKDNACRSNQIFLITLGVVNDSVLIQSILMATQNLVLPGAIRSLNDAQLTPALPIYNNGQLLNNPDYPYWGSYSGDEDTRRKPAYHNGTGWAWPFFSYCEALYMHTKDRARCLSILMSAKQAIEHGIVNHLPEICDGNAPHQQKGCKAQAWSVTEYYRAYKTISQQQ